MFAAGIGHLPGPLTLGCRLAAALPGVAGDDGVGGALSPRFQLGDDHGVGVLAIGAGDEEGDLAGVHEVVAARLRL